MIYVKLYNVKRPILMGCVSVCLYEFVFVYKGLKYLFLQVNEMLMMSSTIFEIIFTSCHIINILSIPWLFSNPSNANTLICSNFD